MIQVRMNMNRDGEFGEHLWDNDEVKQVSVEEPLFDYRDSNEIWLWIGDNVQVAMSRDLVNDLYFGFIDQFGEEGSE